MSEPIFFSQGQLETWLGDEEVTFEGDVITLLAQNAAYTVTSAVKITLFARAEFSKAC